jgi:hypothetical protein
MVLRSAIEAHGGWLFKHTGDGVCADSKGGPFSIAGAIGTSNHDGVTHPVINQPTTGTTIKTALKP